MTKAPREKSRGAFALPVWQRPLSAQDPPEAFLYRRVAPSHFELELVVQRIGVDDHVIPVQDFAVEDLDRQRILNQPLDGPFQRTSAVGPVVSAHEELVA